jgi:hypothetical protein
VLGYQFPLAAMTLSGMIPDKTSCILVSIKTKCLNYLVPLQYISHQVTGRFVPLPLRPRLSRPLAVSSPSRFVPFTFRPIYVSFPSRFVPFTFRPLHVSSPSRFVPFTFRPLHVSSPSRFVPFTFRPLHVSSPSRFVPTLDSLDTVIVCLDNTHFCI